MQNDQEKFFNILTIVYEHYLPLLIKDDCESVKLMDPNDKKVIGFHYGETHMGAAFIIGGIHFNRDDITEIGVQIINGFMVHSKEYQKEIAYHWDFNNFALCTLYEYLEENKRLDNLRIKIKQFVLTQKDSDNATINWYPMRIYVNDWKYRWTRKCEYLNKVNKLKKKISVAQYKDGFIEDLLPKGTSFNLQYHMFTTAMLAFLRLRGIEIANLDLAVSRAIDMMDYQGDINYLGRGNNQLFAWGPAVYLYKSLEESKAYNSAFNYVYGRSIETIQKNNLILNDTNGEDKVWWWDYHFCSVYTAHYLMWMMLAAVENRKIYYENTKPKVEDSGMHIHKGDFCVVTFDGRKHYLAESGKMIADITDGNVCYFKGTFGPFFKDYGFLYSVPVNTIHNFIGVITQCVKSGGLYIKTLYPDDINVDENDKELRIELLFKKSQKGIFNLPLFIDNTNVEIKNANAEQIMMNKVSEYRGPYGMVNLYQSREMKIDSIVIKIAKTRV